jgi:hypothetical protein
VLKNVQKQCSAVHSRGSYWTPIYFCPTFIRVPDLYVQISALKSVSSSSTENLQRMKSDCSMKVTIHHFNSGHSLHMMIWGAICE